LMQPGSAGIHTIRALRPRSGRGPGDWWAGSVLALVWCGVEAPAPGAILPLALDV